MLTVNPCGRPGCFHQGLDNLSCSGARLAARFVVCRCKSGFGLTFLVFDWVFWMGVGGIGVFLAELLAISALQVGDS